MHADRADKGRHRTIRNRTAIRCGSGICATACTIQRSDSTATISGTPGSISNGGISRIEARMRARSLRCRLAGSDIDRERKHAKERMHAGFQACASARARAHASCTRASASISSPENRNANTHRRGCMAGSVLGCGGRLPSGDSSSKMDSTNSLGQET